MSAFLSTEKPNSVGALNSFSFFMCQYKTVSDGHHLEMEYYDDYVLKVHSVFEWVGSECCCFDCYQLSYSIYVG